MRGEHAISFCRHREDPRAGELDRLERLVADHPRIVTGRNVIDVVDADFARFARIAFHMEPPAEHNPLMMDLAGMRMSDRTDVTRPSPSGLEKEPPDRGLAIRYGLDYAHSESAEPLPDCENS